MPSIRGYNPGGRRGEHAYGEDVRGKPIDNPDGMFSGMTRGLAIDGDGFVDISDMPPDARDTNPLPYYDRDDLFLED